MEKEIKNTISTKSNSLIDAGFFKKLNSMEMRIFNLAISRLNPTRSVSQNKQFEFTVKEFLDFNTGLSDKNNAYENVKNAVLNLGKIWVEVSPIGTYEKTEVSLLTRRSYSKGKGFFMIEFHEDIMPYLVEIKNNFTSILLEIIGSLKSEYSLKLYEILSRWAYKGNVTFSFLELKNLLNVGDKYDRYNNFNQWVLKPSLKEINAKTDLIVSIQPIRTGRAITDLKFSITPKCKSLEVNKVRPKFPHKNKYGKFVKLNKQSPKMSSHEFDLYGRDCLKILENFYEKIEDVTTEDLRNYWVFLATNDSNSSKLGGKKVFINELKKRGYKLIECELERI